MSYEMIVLDLDNTLLNEDHKLDKKTVETVKKLKNLGKKVTIATGRMYVSALPFIEKLNIDLPVISYNGAYVYDPVNEEVIFHKAIPKERAFDIINETEKANMHINLYREDKFFVEERNEGVEVYEKIAGIRGIEIGKLSENFNDSPTKMLIVEKDLKKKNYYLEYFKENYSDSLEITESKEIFIEFMAEGVSKAAALKELSKTLNIDKENIIALGDGFNDLEMIEWAGLGIAMDNAPSGVKKRADIIAPHHNENGAAKILKKIFDF